MINLITSTKNKLGNIWAKPFAFLAFALLLLSGKAISQSADIDQGQNGSATSRVSPVKWINGNLGPSGAHFAEGYSIPYRMKIASLVGNASTVHHLIIEWDTKDQNGHALDYITYYNNMDNPSGSHQANFHHAVEAIQPTDGTAFSGTPSLFQIPTPSSAGAEVAGMPGQSFTDLPTAGRTGNANATKMAIWGGTITALTYVSQDNQDATTASTKSSIDISFTSANGSTALIAWGGHIAAEYDWGVGRGASKVSGSPYHMRLISIDGKGGNQDRSLKATAVLVPTVGCTISAAQTACEGTSGPLTYSVTGSPSGVTNYSWTLTPGTTNAVISGGNTTTTKSGATVTSINIVPATGTTFAVGNFSVSLTLTNLGGAGTPCTQTGSITAKPARPTVTYKGPECNETTFSVTVVGAATGGSYTLTQDAGGVGPFTKTTAADANANGDIVFSGLTVGKGFSVTLTNAAGCTSDATDCANYKTAITANSKAQVAQPLVQENASGTKVIAAPNPFNDYIRFTITPAESGRGSLDLYNLLGQKVKTVYQGNVVKGQSQTIEYSVPNTQRSLLIYRFQVGTQSVTGKLLGLK